MQLRMDNPESQHIHLTTVLEILVTIWNSVIKATGSAQRRRALQASSVPTRSQAVRRPLRRSSRQTKFGLGTA